MRDRNKQREGEREIVRVGTKGRDKETESGKQIDGEKQRQTEEDRETDRETDREKKERFW